MITIETFMRSVDLGATFVFALSGAVAAVNRRLDIFGILVLSFVAGNFGGSRRMLRAAFHGDQPWVAFADSASLCSWTGETRRFGRWGSTTLTSRSGRQGKDQSIHHITMSKKKLIFGVACIVIIGAGSMLYSTMRPSAGTSFIDPADKTLVTQGKAIYANYCAACHGESLQGQPGWRERMANGKLPAPPHDKTGHTWHHPDAMLVDMVKNGLVPGRTAPPGYVSDMPGYGVILTDQEVIAVIAYIKSSWPPKVLQAQKEVTLQRQD